MRFFAPYRRVAGVAGMAGLLLASIIVSGCGPKTAPPAPAKPKTEAANAKGVAAAQTNAPADEYASLFEDLLPPQGKDPFFPDSRRRIPVTPVATSNPAFVDPALELKAIIHTARHSQAVVNNAILEVGEQGSVHVPNGKVQVQCIEIGADYVVVRVEGEAETKRLVMEHKK